MRRCKPDANQPSAAPTGRSRDYADDLALWLRADPVERSQAAVDLIASNDLIIIPDGDTFTVARAHGEIISRLEAGSFPLPMAAMA